jgi:hypothetical protein
LGAKSLEQNTEADELLCGLGEAIKKMVRLDKRVFRK